MDKKLLPQCTFCSSQEVTTASSSYCKVVLDLDSPGHQEKREIIYNQHSSSIEE